MVRDLKVTRLLKQLAIAAAAVGMMPAPTALATSQVQNASLPWIAGAELPGTTGLLQQARLLATGAWSKAADDIGDYAPLFTQAPTQASRLSAEQMIERVLSYYPQPDANDRARVAQALRAERPETSSVAHAGCPLEDEGR